MSGSLEKATKWTYRISEQRLITIKAKNSENRKLTATDLKTNLSFAIDVPQNVPVAEVEAEKPYFASLKVYTAKDVKDTAPEYSEFFNVLDVDQPFEDFLKVYLIYPKLIRFELAEVEPANE